MSDCQEVTLQTPQIFSLMLANYTSAQQLKARKAVRGIKCCQQTLIRMAWLAVDTGEAYTFQYSRSG